MNRGTFYAGRNIDRQQGRILAVEKQLGRKLNQLWAVRRKVFPEYSLGELHGWEGMDLPRKKVYKNKNHVLLPGDSR